MLSQEAFHLEIRSSFCLWEKASKWMRQSVGLLTVEPWTGAEEVSTTKLRAYQG